jgi:hypothetical protein
MAARRGTPVWPIWRIAVSATTVANMTSAAWRVSERRRVAQAIGGAPRRRLGDGKLVALHCCGAGGSIAAAWRRCAFGTASRAWREGLERAACVTGAFAGDGCASSSRRYSARQRPRWRHNGMAGKNRLEQRHFCGTAVNGGDR